jgi:DHA1 family tetracycline resistance protein-like MFS transporter
MSAFFAPRRRITFCVHAAVFVAAAAQSEIVPLLPRIGHRYGVSATGIALLVAAPGVSMLALCLPIGVLTDRLGARRLTLAGCVVLCIASLGQALPAYAAVLVARLLFGVAFGTLFTAGLAWLSGSAGESGSSRLGATVTSASVGVVLGPAIGGLLGQGAGLATPFLITAAAAGLVTVAVLASPRQSPDVPRARARSGSLRELVSEARREPGLIAGAGALLISGAVASTMQLLVPLELHRIGASASSIGLAFSASACLYILISAIVVAGGPRAISLRLNAIAALTLTLALLPAALSTSAAAVGCTLLAVTVPRATIGTIAYPLATSRATRARLGSGVAIGLLNAVWASSIVVAPLLAGGLSQGFGARAGFVAMIVASAVGGSVLLVHARRTASSDGRARSVGHRRGEPAERAEEALAAPRRLALPLQGEKRPA